jgi:DNA-binding response OmpR family regulator
VEDEPGLVEVLTVNLEHAGYQVLTAADGLEAWRRFSADHPDIIVLDLNLPTMSGFRLLQLIKRSDRPVPVVVLTAFSFEEAKEVAQLGVEGFITKPFEPGDLVRTVHRALARVRQMPPE